MSLSQQQESSVAPAITMRDAITRFGSAESLNWRVLALFAIPAFSSTLFFELARLGGSPWGWFWLTVSAYLVTVVAIWLGSELTNQRSWQRSRPLAVLAIVTIAGLIRGLFMYFVGVEVGLIPADDLLYRLIVAPLFVAFLIFFFSLPVTTHLDHKRMLATLAEERAQLDSLGNTLATRVTVRRRELAAQARQLLEPAIWELRKHLADAVGRSSVQNAVSEISKITDSMVRPISHRFARENPYLATKQAAQPSTVESTPWPKRVVLGSMMPVFLLFVSIVVIGGPAAGQLEGVARGTFATLVLGVAYALLYWLLRLVFSRVEMATVPAAILVTLSSAAIGFSFYPLNALLGISPNFGPQSMIFLGQVAAVMFVFQLIQLRRQQLIAQLVETNETLELLNSKLEQELWLTQRDISLLLHGPVQGAFYAAAMKLANAGEIRQPLIDEIREDIEQAMLQLNSLPGERNNDVEAAIANIADVWGDALNIDLVAQPELLERLASDNVASRVVIEVVREAITNVAKHSSATWVQVRLERLGNLLRIEVTNQGLPTRPLGVETGLGSELYDSVSLNWSLEARDGNTVLEMAVAMVDQLPSASANSGEVGGSQPSRSQTSAAATAATSAARDS